MAGHSVATCIEIAAPARLHLGFLDLNGGLGRRFGSLGLTIDGISTRLVMRRAERAETSGPSAARAMQYLIHAATALGLSDAVSIEIEHAIPEHVGLGSGTQLGLAVATGLTRLDGIPRPTPSLAEIVERGARSGIGIAAFDHGGFLVDGGRRADGGTPPLISRLAFPSAWRLVLIFDRDTNGLHGDGERAAFTALPPMEEAIAANLCRVLVMQLLPGVADAEFTVVSEALAEIQMRVGDHFAAAQGGRFASARVSGILAWLRGQGVIGLGQTSWGPTGFALVDSAGRASEIETDLRRHFADQPAMDFLVVAGRNQGAEIVTGPHGG